MGNFPGERGSFAEKVAGGITWKIDHLPSLAWLGQRASVEGLLITVSWGDGPIQGGVLGSGKVSITLSEASYELCFGDRAEFETSLANAFASAFAVMMGVSQRDEELVEFLRAWNEASPGIRMDAVSIAQVEVSPPDPERISGPRCVASSERSTPTSRVRVSPQAC
jgi:hypothetical protein